MLARIALLVTLFAACAFAKSDAKSCALELQEILYTPQSCALDYFKRLARDFPQDAPAYQGKLSTSNTAATDLIGQFITYTGVNVAITDTDGKQYYFTVDNGTASAVQFTNPSLTHDMNQALLNNGGYTFNLDVTKLDTNLDASVNAYSFLTFSADGQVRIVSLWAPLGTPNCFNIC